MKEKMLGLGEVKTAGTDLVKCILGILLSIVIGIVVGLYASLFGIAIGWVTDFRLAHSWLVYLLPIGGILIVGFYRLLKIYEPGGTNRVLKSITSGEAIPISMVPLITVSTIITHFFGGSAGREGAAIQIGGSMGMQFGKLLKMDQQNIVITTMSGMSAAFAALFGTPLTATVFSIEVITIGIMHYSALVPCAVSSFTAYLTAKMMGLSGLSFSGVDFPTFDWLYGLKAVGFGVVCAIVGVLFILALKYANKLYCMIANKYIRTVAGAATVILLMLIVGNQDYLGIGSAMIHEAVYGTVVPYAFVLKMIFTAVTLAACFKGGEIVPTIFIGATFGCIFGPLMGIPSGAAAAMGICGVFCAVTNCPITSIFLSFELFGVAGLPMFAITAAVSYRLSGYFGLYSGQKIMYSKSLPKFINMQTRH